MTTVFRLIGACLACVFAASIGATLIVTLAAMADGIAHQKYAELPVMLAGAAVVWVLMAAVSWIYSLPAAILVGIPAHYVLRRLRFDGIAAFAIIGAVAGLLIGLFAPLPFPPYRIGVLYVLMMVAAGAAGGVGFHLVMRAR